MRAMSYTESRAKYAEVLDLVTDDQQEIMITRAGHEPVVIISLQEYKSLRETSYLMRSPANARRLLDSVERLEAGGGEEHERSAMATLATRGRRLYGGTFGLGEIAEPEECAQSNASDIGVERDSVTACGELKARRAESISLARLSRL